MGAGVAGFSCATPSAGTSGAVVPTTEIFGFAAAGEPGTLEIGCCAEPELGTCDGFLAAAAFADVIGLVVFGRDPGITPVPTPADGADDPGIAPATLEAGGLSGTDGSRWARISAARTRLSSAIA